MAESHIVLCYIQSKPKYGWRYYNKEGTEAKVLEVVLYAAQLYSDQHRLWG